MDVASWLRDLGLEQYERAFRDNDIDREVLPQLTAEDLTGLGVVSIGHRRKLLAAADALKAAPPVQPPPAEQRPAAPAVSGAERRRLTVMFVDLAGSTELSARLDPEEMNEVLRSYRTAVAAAIARFEGHVAKLMGDGVLAYFGWPRAHEDEAERAVRAGLAITAAVDGIRSPDGERIAARVGIATGLVMVGELVGEGVARERSVVGETPNLAARLQSLAAPGAVVVAAATRRLLGDLFELQDLGTQPIKGLAEPVPAFAVSCERASASRFEAHGGLAVLPMEGRDQELALLLDRWSLARTGEGQGVLLVGEAGLGKSRITRALIDAVAAEPHVLIRLQCSPYHTGSALWPVIEHLRHAAGFATDDSRSDRLDKLEAVVRQGSGDVAGTAPLFAELLGLEAEERYGRIELTPQARRARTLKALSDELVALAAREPVLLMLEDAHWLDPSTLEVIELYLDRGAAARILTVVTSRPDRQPELAAHPHVTRLTLNRLGRAGVKAIIASVSGDKALPDAVIDTIVSRTDGVPLFVEEMTKAVLETGVEGELRVPASLHDSLMARLDRLPEVKEVAQAAACIGRVFDYPLLLAVVGWPEGDLAAALGELAAAELVSRHGTPPEASYTFKHALVRDAAHESLLRSRRQTTHRRIAELLEERLTNAGETGPEVLARHLTDAGLAARAVPYWRRAGELAAERSANLEAIAHLTKGLELVGTLPDAPGRLDEELALLLAIGGPVMASKGFAAPEVERAYGRAQTLCDQLGRSAELFPVLRGLWNCYLVRGEYQRAHDLAERLIALAGEQGQLRRALAQRALGTTLFFLGRFTEATAALDQGIATDDAVAAWEDPAHLLPYTERAGVAGRLYSAWALWFRGFPDGAVQRMEAGLALSRRLGHASGLAFALTWAAALHNLRREFDTAYGLAEAAVEIAHDHRMSAWFGHASVCRGFAMVGLGRQGEGSAQLRAGLAAWNATGGRLLDSQWLGLIADAHVQAGQLDDARDALGQAARITAATGERHYQAELYRLRGALLVADGETAEAASWLRRAVDTARGQQARSLELRAATSLARLWRDDGKRTEALDLLAPTHGWFTEGFDTPDLKDAKALVDELS